MMQSTRHTVFALMGITAASQGFGLLRDFLLARQFLISAQLEGFLFAEAIPLALTILFVSLVPLTIVPRLIHAEAKQQHGAVTIYLGLVRYMVAALLGLAVLAFLLSETIVAAIGSQLNSDTQQVAVLVIRALAPNIVFTPLLSLNTALLNAKGVFIRPALALLAINVCSIAGIIVGVDIVWVAVGTSIGGAIALVYTSVVIERLTRDERGRAKGTTFDLGELAGFVMPAVFYVAVNSAIILAEKNAATWAGFGTVTMIAYGTKIVGVPQHLFNMSFVRVRIALYSRLLAQGKAGDVRRDYRRSLLVMLGVSLGLAAMLALGSATVVRLLFGDLAAAQSAQIATVVAIMTLGLFPSFVNALSVGVACSNEKMRYPFFGSLIQLAAFILVAFVGIGSFGAVGVAAAVVAGQFAACFFWFFAYRRVFS